MKMLRRMFLTIVPLASFGIGRKTATQHNSNEAIVQAIGRASMCWEHPERAGEFLNAQALQVAEDLQAQLEQRSTWEAFAVIVQAMKNDSSYAWCWHCNIAMSIADEGVDHATANRAAARFMSLLGVDVTKLDEWKMITKQG